MKQWHKRTRTALSAVLLSVVLFVGTLLSGGAVEAKSKVKTKAASAKTTASGSSGFSLTMLDVGQGLSCLIKSDGQYMLYDGGPRESSSYVVSYLQQHGVSKLTYLVASHYDEDHIAGLVGVLNTTPVTYALTPDYVADTKIYASFENGLAANGANDIHPIMGDVYTLGKAQLQVVGPAYYTHPGDNDNSIAIRITYGNTSFLLTGDAEEDEEYEMVASGLPLDSDVYVVGHHGSDSSSTTELLNAVTPSYALISVGKGNSYGHPTEGALTRLTAAGAKIFRTDDQGEITVVSDGKTLTFSTDPTTDLTPGSASKGSSSSGSSSSGSSSSLSSSSSSSAVTTPSTTPSGGYVLNTHTKKFHLPTCSSVSQMKEKNRAYSNESRDQLISEGYSPCKKCNP
ncbi:MAG: ComEC/Rec2 family competence protein [Lachnospiraceae bacterium]|jgi:competence protein ComEC